MLSCPVMRTGSLANSLRKAVHKIRKKNGLKTNIFKISKMLIKVSKKFSKKRATTIRHIKRVKKIMKKTIIKLIRGKRIKPATIILLKRTAKSNCNRAQACFKKNSFSRKCYIVSKACIQMKGMVKNIEAKKVSLTVSSLIKNFLKQ